MKKRYFILLIGVLFLLACGGDDGIDQQNPDLINMPPSSFKLIEVPDKSVDVSPTPLFEWDSTLDPDGDPITYDLYLDTVDDPTNKLAGNITSTTFIIEPNMRLSLARDYYWKVVAKDGKGGETSSPIFKFKVKPLDNAQKMDVEYPFDPSENHASVVFNHEMWVLGGFSRGTASNKPMESPDGNKWSILIVTPEERFTPRFFHAATVFEDKIWVAGGIAEGTFASDVWHSDTGGRWTNLDQNTGFPQRAEHTLTSFNNSFWVIGGSNSSGKLSDVYSSPDGASWTKAVEQAEFGKPEFSPDGRLPG